MFHEFREKYEEAINEWARLRKAYKTSFEDLSKQFGFSRAMYCRKRKILKELDESKKFFFRSSQEQAIAGFFSISYFSFSTPLFVFRSFFQLFIEGSEATVILLSK